MVESYPEVAEDLSRYLESERATIPKTKPIGWININVKKRGM
ncbi:hypothetical protein RMSM_04296 [Rhodopirellula maiorica SM1]|uniref:Uncharacterized protein n=1 Tax=Rhodopirellula maiorica SM1 TaxID=1265738 RepID=M5RHW0_9BACT|nr:hypothetical protein RMSM_04296 [Rhodopirellula maiorica SM1]